MSQHNRNRKIAKWAVRGVKPGRRMEWFSVVDFNHRHTTFKFLEPVAPQALNPLGVLVTSKRGKRNLRKVLRGERSLQF